VKNRILAGEPADMAIVLRSLLNDLSQAGKIANGSIIDLARSPVVLTVRAGAPKPDIGSVDAFKRTMLAADSIAYADPASGGLSGLYFAAALARLGIADQMKPKTKLVGPAKSGELVARFDDEAATYEPAPGDPYKTRPGRDDS